MHEPLLVVLGDDIVHATQRQCLIIIHANLHIDVYDFNVLVFKCYNATLQQCFTIKVGVHGDFNVPFCSLDDFNNKDKGGVDFNVLQGGPQSDL